MCYTPGEALVRHRLRTTEAEGPLAAAYNSTVEEFASAQLRFVRADHTSGQRDRPAKPARAAAASAEAAGGEAAGSGDACRECETGDAETGDAATGDAATGDAASGEVATGEAATGEAATAEVATAEAVTFDTAQRIDAMQEMVLSWQADPSRPTAFDVCHAHAALIPGGGMLRLGAVRAGNTRFGTAPNRVQAELEKFVAALQTVSARDDLSPVAKAAWACYNLLALHPFADGNGRLARALANCVLARHGMPFVVCLAASATQRTQWRAALEASHKAKDVRPFAALVRTCISRAWAALEPSWDAKRKKAVEAAAGARARSARDEARRSGCLICLDEGPTCSLLCCGGAFHMRCLSRWLSTSGTSCPQCRAPVPPEERPSMPNRARADADAELADGTSDGTSDDLSIGWSELDGSSEMSESSGTSEDDDSYELAELLDDSYEPSDDSQPSDDTEYEAAVDDTQDDDSFSHYDDTESAQQDDDTHDDDTEADDDTLSENDDTESAQPDDDTQDDNTATDDDTVSDNDDTESVQPNDDTEDDDDSVYVVEIRD